MSRSSLPKDGFEAAGPERTTGLTSDGGADGGRIQPERPDVFISYSRKDGAFVHRLTGEIESRGSEVWVDWDDIRKGADWRATIQAGIEASKAVVAVLSSDFAASEICDEEIAYAVSQNKRLVPILHRDVDPKEVRDELNRPNWIFFRDGDDFDTAVVELLDAVETDLDWLDQHARLLVRAREWEREGRDASFVLRGRDLRVAETWLTDAAGHAESPTALQTAYIVASRGAATRRQRLALGAVGAALAVTVGLAVFALLQRNSAIANEHRARSREVAASALAQMRANPELGLLLAVDSAKLSRTEQARKALIEALSGTGPPRVLLGDKHDLGESAIFSPDGRRLVATTNGPLRIFDVPTGRRIALVGHVGDELSRHAVFSDDGRRLVVTAVGAAPVILTASGHRVGVLRGRSVGDWYQAMFTPGGKYIVVADTYDAVGIWRSSGGPVLRVIHLDDAPVDVAVDPTGKILATVTLKGKVRLWRLPAATPIASLPGSATNDADTTAALAFSPTGHLLAVGATDGSLRLWQLPSGKLLTVQRRDKGAISSVAFSDDGRLLLTGGSDKTLRLWNTAGADAGSTYLPGLNVLTVQQSDQVGDVAFSHDGLLAANLVGGAARISSLAEGARVATVQEAAASAFSRPLLTSVAFSPDSHLLATSSINGNVFLWRVPDGRHPIAVGGDERFVATAVSGDGRRMLVAPKNRAATIHDLTAPRTPVSLGAGGRKITSAAFSPDGEFVLTHGADEMSRVWAATGEQVGAWRDPAGRSAALTPTGDVAVTMNDDNTAHLWRVKDGQHVAAVKLYSAFPVLALSSDGRRLVATGHDGPARIWDTATGQVIARLRVNLVADAVAVSPNGDTVAVAYGDGTTRLWEGMNGRLRAVLPAHGRSVDSMAFSPDGTRLAAAAGNTVRIWDVRSGTQVAVVRTDVGGVVITSFSPDGRFILTAGFLGTTTVWDAATGEALANFRGADGPATVWEVKAGYIFDARKADGLLTGAWFTNDGEHVVTATIRGAVREYTCELCVSNDEFATLARQRATRQLTPEERETYLGG